MGTDKILTIPCAPEWAHRMKLWAAINRYAEGCGAKLDSPEVIGERLGGVIEVENEIDALVAAVRREEG